MLVRTLNEDLGLPKGHEFTVDLGTAQQWIAWQLVEAVEVAAPPEAAAKAPATTTKTEAVVAK